MRNNFRRSPHQRSNWSSYSTPKTRGSKRAEHLTYGAALTHRTPNPAEQRASLSTSIQANRPVRPGQFGLGLGQASDHGHPGGEGQDAKYRHSDLQGGNHALTDIVAHDCLLDHQVPGIV